MALGFLLGGFAVLLAVHLTRSRFRRRVISAARFFKDLPPPRKSSPKLSFNNPLKIPAFYLRMLLLGVLFLAIWAKNRNIIETDGGRYHVWYVLDSSSSMTTSVESATYWELGKAAMLETHQQWQNMPKVSGRFRLSLLDLALRDAGQGNLKDDLAMSLANQMPRALGTDLGLLRRELVQSLATAQTDPYTHVVIFSDRPVPAWVGQISDGVILWHDISKPVVNFGIEQINPIRNPLTGGVDAVQVVVASYGLAKPDLRVKVTQPGMAEPSQLAVNWRSEHQGSVDLDTARAGTYAMELSSGGAYAGDDRAEIDIPVGNGVRVDWQLQDQRLPRLLGWEITDQNPRLRVGSGPPDDRARPYLWVGNGIVAGASEIRDFVEDSPLLADLHFDVVEQFEPVASPVGASMSVHLRDTGDGIWAAIGQNPSSAFVPGLPGVGDSAEHRLLTTLFFNGVRWLLEASDPEPIYTLTSPLDPLPRGNRLNLHPGEGDTSTEAVSQGSMERLTNPEAVASQEPWWPRLLSLAALLFLAERALSLWGGRRWH